MLHAILCTDDRVQRSPRPQCRCARLQPTLCGDSFGRGKVASQTKHLVGVVDRDLSSRLVGVALRQAGQVEWMGERYERIRSKLEKNEDLLNPFLLLYVGYRCFFEISCWSNVSQWSAVPGFDQREQAR